MPRALGIASLFLLSTVSATAQVERDVSLDAVRLALMQGAEELPAVEASFRERLASFGGAGESFEQLFGYDPPGRALQLAWLHAWLFEREGDPADARAAAELLRRMAEYRALVPDALRTARVEYADGLPAVPSFFHLADYADAWARVRAAATDEERAVVDEALAGSAEFVFVFPEWGAHNRALLRAVGLQAAARALPDDPRAERWRRMSEVLGGDSVDRWEIEDAQIYHPIWLQALERYRGADALRSIQGRYYLRYFLELMTPYGTIADFGDAWWAGGQSRYYELFARGAAALGDPELAWAAERAYAAMPSFDPERPGLGHARLFAELEALEQEIPAPRAPELASGPVLDELIGKKVALRRGSSFLLLNYRDEGDWGLRERDYLRRTLAVTEEKMHHGHADENAIVSWIDGDSVLLHEAGYRERAPSGPYGAYRADLFHDRLVARRGAPAAGESALEFLRDDGAYRRVRTQAIDFVAFEDWDYSRTRVEDAELGYRWDRTLVAPRDEALVVVIDTVELTRTGNFSFATLWATGAVEASGPGWARGRTARIGEREFPVNRELLVVYPGRPDAPPPHFELRRHNAPESVLHELHSITGTAGERLAFVTVLASVAPGTDGAQLARRCALVPFEPQAQGVALRIAATDDQPERTIVVKADLALGALEADVRPREDPEAARWAAGELTSDADLLLVRDRSSWAATGIGALHVQGRPRFEARPLQLFQPSGRSDVAGRARWRRWEGELE